MNCSMPGLPIHHRLLEFTQTHVHWVSDAIQPSHPLSSPSPPAPNWKTCYSMPFGTFLPLILHCKGLYIYKLIYIYKYKLIYIYKYKLIYHWGLSWEYVKHPVSNFVCRKTIINGLQSFFYFILILVNSIICVFSFSPSLKLNCEMKLNLLGEG